jgi:hypothetical protein
MLDLVPRVWAVRELRAYYYICVIRRVLGRVFGTRSTPW